MGLKDFFKGREQEQEEPEAGQLAFAVPNSNRSLWGGGLVRGLSPEKLAQILDTVRQGEVPAEYLEIAQELEQRDAHYRSVLSTRKHAVEGLEMFVQPAGDSAREQEIAAAVEEGILNHPDITDLRKNALDALGKGFSVNEIVWDTSGPPVETGNLSVPGPPLVRLRERDRRAPPPGTFGERSCSPGAVPVCGS